MTQVRPGVRVVLVRGALQSIAQFGRDDAAHVSVIGGREHAARVSVPEIQRDQRVTTAALGAVGFESFVAIRVRVHRRVRRVRFQRPFQPLHGALAGGVERALASFEQRSLRGRAQIRTSRLHRTRAVRGL